MFCFKYSGTTDDEFIKHMLTLAKILAILDFLWPMCFVRRVDLNEYLRQISCLHPQPKYFAVICCTNDQLVIHVALLFMMQSL